MSDFDDKRTADEGTPTSLPGLFAAASELSPEDRARFLDDLARREPELAAELGDLLASAAGGSPVDRPPWAALAAPAADELPERVGPFRILSELGRGGMGRVFLAEQEGDGFRRRVALKIADGEAARPEALRRFREEVRILASLEHPGIARFLDGGRSASGVAYLALEYVAGADLVTHAHEHGLDVPARVRLFVEVLEAVGAAHERRVVHRDLKPGNILVGADGRPRLLDFGISKLLEPEASDQPVTRTELRALTPAYASPEQVRGEAATPASDLYSLGVVLYELLSGRRPYRTASGARHELERAVLEDDPEPPSTAARRGPVPLAGGGWAPAPRLPRDLDAICLKALRKEPAERYATAEAFADDLRRQLAGLPVAARRGSRRYRALRFALRHRGRIGSAALALVAAGALWLALRGEPTPAPRPFPYSPDAGRAAPTIEELEQRFDAAPASVEAGAELALALDRSGRSPEAALVVARLRQIPGREQDPLVDYLDGTHAMSDGASQRALVLFTRALESAAAEDRGELVAQVRATRGRLLSTMGRREEAISEMQRARAEFEAAGDRASLARVLNDLAIEEIHDGRLASAEAMFEAALAASRAANPKSRGGGFLNNLANLASVRGRPDLAAARFAESIAASRELGSPGRLAFALGEYSEVLRDLGRVDESRSALAESIEILRASGDALALASKLFYRANAELDDALPGDDTSPVDAVLDELEAIAKSTGNRKPLAYAEVVRGRLAEARGELDAARRHLTESSRLFEIGGEPDNAIESDLDLAALEHRAGRRAEALRLVESALARLGPEHGSHALAEWRLVRLEAEEGRSAEAQRRLDRLEGGATPAVGLRAQLARLAARAAVARARGDEPAARADFERAIAQAESGGRRALARELRAELGPSR